MALRKVAAFLGEEEYRALVQQARESNQSVSLTVVSILTGRQAPIAPSRGEKKWSKHRQARSKEST